MPIGRATDTKLNREVAIKVLPTEVAQDPERLARFQREAQLLAALNHPNVAAIHGLKEAEGTPFLALELVEGEDLSERLKRGKVPIDEALDIAMQIAEALEAAHEKGIVHRDLKPANVMITPVGQVKVLDFGLAKAWAGDPGRGFSTHVGADPAQRRPRHRGHGELRRAQPGLTQAARLHRRSAGGDLPRAQRTPGSRRTS